MKINFHFLLEIEKDHQHILPISIWKKGLLLKIVRILQKVKSRIYNHLEDHNNNNNNSNNKNNIYIKFQKDNNIMVIAVQQKCIIKNYYNIFIM